MPRVDPPPAEILATIAAYGHPDAQPVPLALSLERWRTVRPMIHEQRLVGIAAAAAEAGRLEVREDLALRELLPAQRDEMLWCLEIERHLVVVAHAFAAAGLHPVALKGPAYAHRIYPEPSWRPFSDLDLLVPAAERAAASRVLAASGYLPARPSPRAHFDDRFGKAVVHRGPGNVEVDLHRTLAPGPFAVWIDPVPLLHRATPLTVGGATLRALDATGTLLHACVHAVLGQASPSLLMQRDIAQAWAQSDVDWDLVASLSRTWHLGAVLRRGMGNAATRLDLPLPAPAAEVLRREPAPEEVWALHSYSPARRRRAGPELALLRALPGVRDRAAYATSLLVPSREFLSAREQAGGDPNYRSRWTSAARRLVRGGERS